MVSLFHGKSQSKMDDDWGYPYDLGNLHMTYSAFLDMRWGIRSRKSDKKTLNPTSQDRHPELCGDISWTWG